MRKEELTWVVAYEVGNWHKTKYVKAPDAETAIKRARVKNIELLDIVEYQQKDRYLLRDF